MKRPIRILQVLGPGSPFWARIAARYMATLCGEQQSMVFTLTDAENLDEEQLTAADRVILHWYGMPLPDMLIHRGVDALFLGNATFPGTLHLYDDTLLDQLRQARRQLRLLSRGADFCAVYCRGAADLLEDMGAARVRTVPLCLPLDALSAMQDEYQEAAIRLRTGPYLAWYGFTSHACGLRDALVTTWYMNSFVDSRTRRMLVSMGPWLQAPGTLIHLNHVQQQFSIPPEAWLMMDDLEPAAVISEIRNAELYIDLDRGDLAGFGTLTAIALGRPVIAAGLAAEELLGDAPLFFREPIHSALAESIDHLQKDEQWREKVLKRQARVLQRYSPAALAQSYRSILSRFSTRVSTSA